MADKTITLLGPDGDKYEVKDTPANRDAAKEQGFTVDQSLIGQAVDFTKGAYEGSLVGRASDAMTDKLREGMGKPSLQATLPDRTGKMFLVGEDGLRHEAKDTEANRAAAKEQGFKVETADETQGHDIAAQPEFQGARGAGHVFTKKMQSEYLFGGLEMAQKAQMTDAQKLAWDEIKDNHETASVSGSATGIVGNLLTPGLNLGGAAAKGARVAESLMAKLGIDAAANLASKVGVGAAKGAAEGLVHAAPSATGQAVFDDSVKAAEGAVAGIGIGSFMGGLGPLAGKFISVVKPMAAESLESAANQRLMKNLGLERGTMKKLGGGDAVEDVASILRDAGIADKPYSSREAMLKAVDEVGEKAGKKIGSVLTDFDAAVVAKPELASNGFNPGTVIKNLVDETKTGAMYESDMRMVIKAGKQIVKDATGKEIKLTGSLEQRLEQLSAHADSLEPVSFKTAQSLKKTFQPEFDKNPMTLTDRDLLERSIYGHVTGELNDAADRMASGMGDESLLAEYTQAKNQYRAVQSTAPMRQNLVAAQDGNRFFSPSDYGFSHMAGALGAGQAAHAGASVLGGGVAGLVGGYAVKRALESTPFQTGVTSALGSGARALRALSADHVSQGIERLAEVVTALGTRGEQAALANAQSGERRKGEPSPIATLMGSKETDAGKAFVEFKKKSDELLKDPDRMQKHFGSMAQTVQDSGDPELATQMANKQLQAWDYLHKNMPQVQVNPAMFYNPEYRPSKSELNRFEELCAIAYDPFYIVRKIEDGKISNDHVDALKSMYPELTGLMKQRLDTMGYENQVKNKDTNYPYNVRMRLNRLTGTLTDPGMSPEQIANLQQGYSKAQNAGGGGSKGTNGKASGAASTDIQRLMGKPVGRS